MSILLSFTKRVAIGYLERSGDPKLLELANWIKDAEEQAVKLVLDILGQGFKANGVIDKSTEARLINVRNSPPPEPPYESWRATVPYLTEYARITHTISALAAWRRAIYLQGFFHRADCSTLWLFEGGNSPSIEITDSLEPFLDFRPPGIKVFILDDMATAADLQAANAQIGINFTTWYRSVNIDEMDSVEFVSEDEVSIYSWIIGETKARRGMIPTKTHNTISVMIEERSLGIDAMVESLPAAIEARDKVLSNVRSKSR